MKIGGGNDSTGLIIFAINDLNGNNRAILDRKDGKPKSAKNRLLC